MDVRNVLLILGTCLLTYCIWYSNIRIHEGEKKKTSNITEFIRERYISNLTMRQRETDNSSRNSNNKKAPGKLLEKTSAFGGLQEPFNLSQFVGFSTLRKNKEISKFKELFSFTDKQSSTLRHNKDSTNLKVYIKGLGRIGNKLFQYVSALGIAHQNNRSVVFNPKMIKLKEIFPRIEVNFLNDTPKWQGLGERGSHTFDPRLFNLPKENMKIGNYLHSFKYFQDIFGDIYNKTLSYFDENLFTKASRFAHKAQYSYKQRIKIETQVTSVCVHVRRGDFLLKHNIKHGFRVPSSQDIQNAMNYMQNKFKHTVFIVISNDIKWCAGNLNRSNVYFSNLTSDNEDFVLMCSCDHMMMTVGTFGWWGAWFTSWRGGIAMYYEHQFSKNTSIYKSLSRHDWFPSHWLAYNNITVIESKYLGDK